MKRTFMIGVAAGALLAGVNIAASQGTMERQPPAASGGGANVEQQKSGSGAQQPQGQRAQDAQKQGDQKATSGQAQQGQQGQRAQDAQKQGDQKQDAQKQGDRQKQDAQKQGDQKQGDQKQDAQKQGDAKSGDGGKTLSAEQKTKVRETVIRSSNAPRVTNVNFSVTVGAVVPRDVRFAPLPPILVDIYPQWRSYQYVIVEERIIIIEPSSYKIVAIVVV
jgi:hypothetical protein